MKRITLVCLNSQYVHSSAVPYILSQNNQDMKLVDMTINDDIENILASIIETQPEEVWFSCYIWNRSMVERLLDEIKRIIPNVRTLVGGPESISLKGNRNVNRVDEGDNPDYISNLNNREFMLGYFKRYCDNVGTRILYLEASLGCPFSCSYCMASLSTSVRLVPIEIVREMIKMAFDSDARQVKFVDRTFNASQDRAMEILDIIKSEYDERLSEGKQIKLGWHFEVAGDLFSDRLLSKIASLPKGLIQFEIGIQSFNDETLRIATRKTNINKVLESIGKILENKNVLLHTDLIAGLPLENLASFKDGFNRLHATKAHQIQLGFLKVLKGVKIEGEAEKYGLVYSNYAPYEIWKTNELSFEEKQLLKEIETVLEKTWNNQRFVYSIEYMVDRFYNGDFFECYRVIAEHLKGRNLIDRPLSAVSMATELELFSENMEGCHDYILIDLYTSSYPVKLPETFKREKMFTKEELKHLYGDKGKNEVAFTRLSDGRVLEINLKEKDILTGKYPYRVFSM